MNKILIPCLSALFCMGTTIHSFEAAEGDMPQPELFGPAAGNDAPAEGDRAQRKAQREERRLQKQNDKAQRNKQRGPKAEDLEGIFDLLDADKDGSVSKEEFTNLVEAQKAYGEQKRKEHEEQLLNEFDVNGDGQLSDEEKQAAKKAHQEQRIKEGLEKLKEQNPEKYAEIDSNADGSIDDDEFAAFQNKTLDKFNERLKKNPDAFARMDSNGDGTIDHQELQAIRQQRNKQQRGGDRGQGGQDMQRGGDKKERRKTKDRRDF